MTIARLLKEHWRPVLVVACIVFAIVPVVLHVRAERRRAFEAMLAAREFLGQSSDVVRRRLGGPPKIVSRSFAIPCTEQEFDQKKWDLYCARIVSFTYVYDHVMIQFNDYANVIQVAPPWEEPLPPLPEWPTDGEIE